MAGGPAAATRPAVDASPAPGLERALATAALRVGDGLPGLGLGTAKRTSRHLDASEAFEELDGNVLCLMLDPPDMSAEESARHSPDVMASLTGLIVLSPGLTDALVEVQTIGRVDGPARPPRRPTRIDAALAQPFTRALLDQVQRLAAADVREPKVGMLRSGSFVAGPDSLTVILTARRYLRLDLELQLGDGVRRGAISIMIPIDAPAPPQIGGDTDPEADWKSAMRAAAMEAPVRLEAVLPPLRLPLSRLLALRVGDLVPLPENALGEVSLLGGSSGITSPGRGTLPRATAMKARLGQLNGVRAVKIAALPGEGRRPPEGSQEEGAFAGASPGLAQGPPPTDPPPDAAAHLPTEGAETAIRPPDPLADLPDLPDLPDIPSPD